MALAHGFLPDTDSGLLAWSLNFSTRISATPTVFGLTSLLASGYATLHSSFATALAASEPGTRSKSTTSTKNDARTALKAQARVLAKIVEAFPSVTDAQKFDLGLNVRAMPTPSPVPATKPAITIKGVDGWTVSLKLSDLASDGKRGRPPRTSGAVLFAYVGATAPSDLKQFQFMGTTGRTLMDLVFSNSLAAGTTVWITAAWFNGAKVNGPLATPTRVVLQGGGVSDVALAA